MKKLGKLSINQSKLLENEELVNLRGGYDYFLWTFDCYCYGHNPPIQGQWEATVTSYDELQDVIDANCGSYGAYCVPC